ncbi:IS5/IS1182 family transposase, partial [Streptomyces sp. NPDC056295]
RRALVGPVRLRRHDTLTRIAAGFDTSVGTAHAYVTAVIGHLPRRTPGLLRVLRETDPDHVLLDVTLAECDRVGDSRQGVPVLADRACIGAGLWVTTPIRRLPCRALTTIRQTVDRGLSAARAPVERSIARLESWRIFLRSHWSPDGMTATAAAVLTLERRI